jgi:hypothetical protein
MCKRYWFRYAGLDGDENDITRYELYSGNPLNHCPPRAKHLCAIYVRSANPNGTIPSLTFYSGNIQTYIGNALSSGLDQPIIGPPYYVLTKTT